MAKFGEAAPEDPRSELVTKICSIATRFPSCAHRPRRSQKTSFVDWYRLLQVDENAGIDIIRKRYRQLALQVHPDKNRHPKAGIAFKFVSEAYACLSDNAKRRTFNSQRRSSFCKECHKKTQLPSPEPHRFLYISVPENPKILNPTPQRSKVITLQALKELRVRLKEEIEVIENGLRPHEVPREELPPFNPSNYMFRDYPHCRTHFRNISNLDLQMLNTDFRYTSTKNIRHYDRLRGKSESPVYEINPISRCIRSRGAHFRS